MKNSRLASLLPLLCVALLACHSGNSMDTLDPHSDLTNDIMDIYSRITWWTVLLFILVQGGLLYIVMRFRERGDEKGNPEQVHGNLKLEIAWTIAPVVILMHIAVPTVAIIFKSQAEPTADALIINAIGKQWWFEFGYPEYGFTNANELHIPEGRQIGVRLQSDNVIHAFWVPQLAAKRDMMPGRVNRIQFTAQKQGTYMAQCAEYCGDSHALMKFRVVVESKEAFDEWVKQQQAPADMTTAEAVAAKPIFASTCAACHAVDGSDYHMTTAPNLTHVGSRTHIAAGILENTKENRIKWISDSDSVKPGSKMAAAVAAAHLTPEQVGTLADWLGTLK